jgi:hypothetical protein
MARHADYDPFAWVYNQHWGFYASRVLPIQRGEPQAALAVYREFVKTAKPDDGRLSDVRTRIAQLESR